MNGGFAGELSDISKIILAGACQVGIDGCWA